MTNLEVEYPYSWQFFGAWFHQDYDVTSNLFREIVSQYIAVSTVVRKQRLVAELTEIIDQNKCSDEFLISIGSDFCPGRFGFSNLTWIETIIELVSGEFRLSKELALEQIEVCKEFSCDYLRCDPTSIIGIADSCFGSAVPINGLRHPEENNTNGWYIWAGEEFSEDVDFFKPYCLEHAIEKCPEIVRFLGLPPGWRFLCDGEYRDVWADQNLLEV